MIIVQLKGGLGNQMFQYALGRNLALRTGMELRLDTSLFARYPHRDYALGSFCIEENLARAEDVERVQVSSPGPWRRLAARLRGRRDPRKSLSSRIKEKECFRFDPSVLEVDHPAYLCGSWQNERYFSEIAERIRREFSVREPPTGRNKELLEQLSEGTYVSLHVRRGDYVEDAHTESVHGACGQHYYRRACDVINQRVGDLGCVVFSDDPDWVTKAMPWLEPETVVDWNGTEQCHEDMRLMRHCRHHIIANSTFSWWGAWLGETEGSLIVAPREWIRDPSYDATDVVPQRWLRLPNSPIQ